MSRICFETSYDIIRRVLQSQSFRYFHEGVWKTGYYNEKLGVFLGKVGNTVTTVINNVKPQYIENLKRLKP